MFGDGRTRLVPGFSAWTPSFEHADKDQKIKRESREFTTLSWKETQLKPTTIVPRQMHCCICWVGDNWKCENIEEGMLQTGNVWLDPSRGVTKCSCDVSSGIKYLVQQPLLFTCSFQESFPFFEMIQCFSPFSWRGYLCLSICSSYLFSVYVRCDNLIFWPFGPSTTRVPKSIRICAHLCTEINIECSLPPNRKNIWWRHVDC